MKLAYLGSPDAAVGPLRELVAAGHEVAIVVSQPDKKRGRGGSLQPSPVKAAALELGIPVSDDPDAVAGVGAELAVVVAYGKLIRPHLLAALPFVNLHFSLLPRWRGAAPVERAVLAGDTETGVCLMGLEEGLDTGPVFRRATTPIGESESADELRARLVVLGAALLVDALVDGVASLGVAEPQSGEPTYAAKLKPEEFELDWARGASECVRLIRLGQAWTTFRGKRLKVPSAETVRACANASPGSSRPGDQGGSNELFKGIGLPDAFGPDSVGLLRGLDVRAADGWVRLLRVQPEGKAVMEATAWRNGAQLNALDRLGT